MTTRTAEPDASLRAAYVGVAASGVLLVALVAGVSGVRSAGAAVLGVVLALSNLWALERVVGIYLAAERGRWGAIGFVKVAGLLGVTALLVKSGWVPLLPLVLGFGALPLGVTVGGLWPTARAPEER